MRQKTKYYYWGWKRESYPDGWFMLEYSWGDVKDVIIHLGTFELFWYRNSKKRALFEFRLFNKSLIFWRYDRDVEFLRTLGIFILAWLAMLILICTAVLTLIGFIIKLSSL